MGRGVAFELIMDTVHPLNEPSLRASSPFGSHARDLFWARFIWVSREIWARAARGLGRGRSSKSTTRFVAWHCTDNGRCPNRCIMSLYLHGYVSLFSSMQSASIPPTTLLCSKMNWSGIPKTPARIGRSFLWNLNSAKHSSFCMSSRSKSGYCS